jgi:hypothetical protein
LRWCEELGITVFWNLLYGFPNESPEEYARMAELVPLLTHLQRPGYCGRIHVDRFSPLFTSAGLGVAEPRPASAYSYLYPLKPHQLGNMAYFFEFEYGDAREPAEYARSLSEEVARWPDWTNPKRPRLDLFQTGTVLLITDTRECASKQTSVLTGSDAQLYVACDKTQTSASVARTLGNSISESEVRTRLDCFRDAGLMAEMDGHYLSLAVLRNRAASATQSNRVIDFRSSLSIIG